MKKWIDNIKELKEEFIAIPILLAIVMVAKGYIAALAPEAAQFNFWEETETLLFRVGQYLLVTLFAWGFLRIIFPLVFSSLRTWLFHQWETLATSQKITYGLWVWTVILLTFTLLLTSCSTAKATTIQQGYEEELRQELHELLEGQLHIRELTGANDGPEVKAYLNAVGLDEGYPWCAAFVSWSFDAIGVDNPRSAWSPHFARKKDIKWRPKTGGAQPEKGDVFTLWYTNLGRVGHVGFIIRKSGNHYVTIEGNTNVEGSRLGIGVFKRKRDSRKIYAVTDYITKHVANELKANRRCDCPDGRCSGGDRMQASRAERVHHGTDAGRQYWGARVSKTRYGLEKAGHSIADQHPVNGGLLWSDQPSGGDKQRVCCKREGIGCGQPSISGGELRQSYVADHSQRPRNLQTLDRHTEGQPSGHQGSETDSEVVLVGDGHRVYCHSGLDVVDTVQTETNI